jgi:putative ABC transport system permease protein
MSDSQYRGVPIAVLSTDVDIFDSRSRVMMLEGTQHDAMLRVRKGAVVVSENFARRFGVHRGQTIMLSTKDGTRGFQVAGVDVDYTNDRGTVLIDRATYTRFFGDTRVDTYKLYVHRGADVLAVRRLIERRFGRAYDLFILTNGEFKAEGLRLLDQVFSVIDALKLVALLIAVLGVVNALFASVLDRVREIAVLRAVGMLRKQARKMVLFEGGLIGVVGASSGLIVGSVLGALLLSNVNLAETGWYFPYRPAWGSIAGTAIAVIVVSALAAWYPAGRAAALVVSEALEYE